MHLDNEFNFNVQADSWSIYWHLSILQLTEDVARKKAEYQKHLDYYKQLRMRFEEHYIKC